MGMVITRRRNKWTTDDSHAMSVDSNKIGQPAADHAPLSCKPLPKQLSWYAVYTRPRHEKKIYARLKQENIETFLPLQTTIRQWSDRKKKVSEPLFSCYVFVYISSKDYYKILNVNGVVRYITFNGKAVSIPEKQIMLIRRLLEQEIEVEESKEPLPKGARVEIRFGPLAGLTGELLENAGKKRVIIRIEEINKALLVNVPLNFLKLIG
jgi:transcription antitermination factor NusG